MRDRSTYIIKTKRTTLSLEKFNPLKPSIQHINKIQTSGRKPWVAVEP